MKGTLLTLIALVIAWCLFTGGWYVGNHSAEPVIIEKPVVVAKPIPQPIVDLALDIIGEGRRSHQYYVDNNYVDKDIHELWIKHYDYLEALIMEFAIIEEGENDAIKEGDKQEGYLREH